jgi:hypothetical protein
MPSLWATHVAESLALAFFAAQAAIDEKHICIRVVAIRAGHLRVVSIYSLCERSNRRQIIFFTQPTCSREVPESARQTKVRDVAYVTGRDLPKGFRFFLGRKPRAFRAVASETDFRARH